MRDRKFTVSLSSFATLFCQSCFFSQPSSPSFSLPLDFHVTAGEIHSNCLQASPCHSFFRLLIQNNTSTPRTNRRTNADTHTHTRTNHQPPSPLDLLSYPRTPYSFPPSGNSFHVNTTSICGAGLSLLASIHRHAAYLSHLQGKQMMFVSIPPRRLDHLHLIVLVGPGAPHRRWLVRASA